MNAYVKFNAQKRIEAEKKRQRWKSVVQIIEQCCTQQNNFKLKK